MSEQTGRLTVTVEEAGKMLGIGRNGAYNAVQSGVIPSLRIGKRILIPLNGIHRLLACARVVGESGSE